MYSGTPPYDHPVYETTSLLRPYSFKPNVKIIESFYYFEDPVNATTSLLRPGFYGPAVVALTGFHCMQQFLKQTVGKLNLTYTSIGALQVIKIHTPFFRSNCSFLVPCTFLKPSNIITWTKLKSDALILGTITPFISHISSKN